MDKRIPSVDFPLVFRGDGVLKLGERTVPLKSIVAERAKYQPNLPWTVHLRIGECDTAVLQSLLHDDHRPPDIEGTADDGRALFIRRFMWDTRNRNNLTGTASDLSLGNIPLATP